MRYHPFAPILLALSLACTRPPATDPVPPLPPGTIRHHETTNPTLGGFEVGISNIYERSLPGPHGEPVAMRPSASLSVYDPKTQKELGSRIVVVGEVVDLGEGKYQIMEIGIGKHSPGFVTFRKVP